VFRGQISVYNLKAMIKSVGENVQEAIDFMNSGSYQNAFFPTTLAIDGTIQKITEKEQLSEDDFKRFIKQKWQLLTFMGMPRALPLPLNIPFGLKRIVPQFNVHHGAEEIVLLVILQSLKIGRLPNQFAVNLTGAFEIKQDKLFLPIGLINGLLGCVIFNTVNKDEEIGEKYWISISDFKMFISELWGREDLAERIMRFYLERD
jgi:hypothetical protein